MSISSPRAVFVTGGSGYLGRSLIPALLDRGHRVRAVVRVGSEKRLPRDCEPIVGNVLDRATYTAQVPPCDTFVHLVGTPRPSPAKARQFRAVDLVSIREATAAAADAGVKHFVYVSVAQPAPIMRAFIAVRTEGEALIAATQLPATILRPWYVLGPGHQWPHVLRPLYWVLERLPSTAASARRLGLVTLEQMIHALTVAVEAPPAGVRVLGVTDIRSPAVGSVRTV